MALVTLNGEAVLSGTLVRPLVGPWLADLVVDAAAVPSGKVTLTADTLSLVGYVVRAQEFHDRVALRCVGGNGGYGKTIAPNFYRSVTLRTLLSDTLTAAGESLSTTSDTSVTSRTVDAWQRVRGTASGALSMIVARVSGCIWRVLADGSTWVGIPTWPTRTLEAVVEDEDIPDGRIDIGTEDYALDAGVTVDGRKVARVRYTFLDGSIRASYWVAA
jgi:hypothetical protein